MSPKVLQYSNGSLTISQFSTVPLYNDVISSIILCSPLTRDKNDWSLDLGSYGAICDTLIEFGYHLETSKTSFLFKLVVVINKVLLPVE